MGIEFMPFLVPIVAILAWAAIQVSKNLGGGPPDDSVLHELRVDIASLGAELEDAEKDRARLRKRIEALEVIATETNRPLLNLDALPDPEADAAESRRQRSRT